MAKTKVTGAKAALPAFGEGKGRGIQQINIKSNKDSSKDVSVVNSTMALLYYESILQDSVRATITFSDSGNTIDEKTAMEGLPIVGQENVRLKFSDNNDNEIEMTLYVNKITPLVQDTRKSVIQLDLASKEFILNEKVRVNKRFNGKIHEHIRALLTSLKDDNGEVEYLGTDKEIDVEDTINVQNFIGNNKKPFYTINWLSRGAVPTKDANQSALKNSAGFFFYETSKGFHFKSIDGLLNTQTNPVKKSYIYNETPDKDGKPPEGYDDKALEYSLDNNVHIQKKLKMGAYSTRIITFNPYNCYYEVINPNAGTTEKGEENTPGDQKKLKLGGKELPALNKEFDMKSPGKEFSRTTYTILDVGSLPDGKGSGIEQQGGTGQVAKSKKENYKPAEVLNQGIMRMNQLFALKASITIPGDFSLHAGDAIYLDAPQLQTNTKNDKVDKQTGGNYIISDVCHYISPKHTLTKLNLVRDSFGRKPKERG